MCQNLVSSQLIRTLLLSNRYRTVEERKRIPIGTQILRRKYLINIVEQDHDFIKKRIRSMLGFKSYKTSASILSSVESMHMVKKEQFDLPDQSVKNKRAFSHQLFGFTV